MNRYRCLGKRIVMTPELERERDALQGRADAAGKAAKDFRELQAQIRSGEVVPDEVADDLAKLKAARLFSSRDTNRLAALRNEREGCGQALDAEIESVDADGEIHAFLCPKCGDQRMVQRTPKD